MELGYLAENITVEILPTPARGGHEGVADLTGPGTIVGIICACYTEVIQGV